MPISQILRYPIQFSQMTLKLGIHSGLGLTEMRKVHTTNFGALVASVSIFVYALIFLISEEEALIPSFWICVPSLCLTALVPYLNHKNHYHEARLTLMMSSTLSILSQIILNQGTILNAYFYFILFAVIPWLIFPRNQYGWMSFFFSVNTFFFAYFFTIHYPPPNPTLLALSENQHSLLLFSLKISYICLSLFSFLIAIIYAETMTQKHEAELKQERDLALLHSRTDSLTKLYNRRCFDEYLHREFSSARNASRSFSVMMIDIDHFKLFNDHYGHLLGDSCIVRVAGSIQSSLWRASDVVARFGGEEFAVLLPGIDLHEAKIIGERIRSSVEALGIPHLKSTTSKFVTISLGISSLEENEHLTEMGLLEIADEALYKAKKAGRNQVAFLQ